MANNDGWFKTAMQSRSAIGSNYKSHSLLNNTSIDVSKNIKNLDTVNDDDIGSLIQANGIYDRLQIRDNYNKFNRFGIIDPFNAKTKTKEYIFITKPNLNLLESSGDLNANVSKNDYITDMHTRYLPLLEQLQYDYSRKKGPFIPLLSNMITSSMDLPGLTSDTIETSANIYGTTMNYRGSSLKSDEDFDFSLEFNDSKYLEVYNLFKIYDEYERMKALGMVPPPSQMYTYRKLLHDIVSIYKLVVGDDGTSLVYWARAVGVTFTSIPRDAFSDMNNNDTQKITVGCKGKFIRDMHPRILGDFNKIIADCYCGGDASAILDDTDLPLYNQDLKAMDGRWARYPYIGSRITNDSQKSKMMKYYLGWKV